MNSVSIDIDREAKRFVLVDEMGLVSYNKRANHFFRNFLHANFIGQEIIIDYSESQSPNILLKKIHDALNKYNICQTDSENVREALSIYFRERQNFTLFSEKAKGIWNNNFDATEFAAFVKTVEKYLPDRTLYPKQLLAAFHLAFSQNACNFSVPGAGKTSIVYAAYSYLKSLSSDDPKFVNKILVIGPLSSFGPWEDEYQECFGKKPRSKRLAGGVSKTEREYHLLNIEAADKTPELILMSYQSVPSNLDELKFFLTKLGNNVMVVLDEAHKIKNVEGGVWATAVLQLAQYCRSRVILTGTPIPNGYEDIYNLYQFIWPERDIINFNIFQLREMSNNKFDDRINRLIDNISPFFIRIKKSDVLPSEDFPIENLPPDLVRMGPVQREIYDFLENQYIGFFEQNQATLAATADLTKARFIRLMQAATNPSLLRQPLEKFFAQEGYINDLFIDDSEIIGKILQYKDLEPVAPKFILIRNKIEALIKAGEKVIIWGTFINSIKDLHTYLRLNGIPSEMLIGEIPVDTENLPEEIITREKIIRKFHEPDSEFRVIIANPFAVAESISLHKACHHAIYFERTFNAANFIQSKDRIHRVGLPKNTITHYHYILSEDSIDETIHQRLIEKERRMLALLESSDIPLISENMNYEIDLENDVKAIIRDYVKRTVKA